MPDFPTETEVARAVVIDPATFHTKPAVLASMWGVLIEARGGTFHADRIGPPAHRVAPCTEATKQAERITARVREHATRQGYLQPPADGSVPA